ncbi:cyclin-D5-3-like isoform X2 [Asparagus officinalis]|uniref:cyclin-D5-3-like isoform X2 n=1 Tax=Asparagus officinalis TaxID=4686 RepID=UPI00098E34C0|nr:cyclin-D5-3-like isoform X2 [Asparagus officinalis]
MEHFPISSLICEEDQSPLYATDNDDDDVTDHKETKHEDEYIEILVSRESILDTIHSSITSAWLKWARSDSVQWIMKTRVSFSFSYQTAYLALTYYDRFLTHRSIESDKYWAFRLLSIACLSLAAKMEECFVPMLSEYQTEDFGFESKTIQRMELLILSTLDWRMNLVTPFAYLSHFTAKLETDIKAEEIVSKSTGFILGIINDINLVEHRPSTIAAAAVLAAYNQRLNKQPVEPKEHVLSCYTMMIEGSRYCSGVGDKYFSTASNKRRRLKST